MAARTAKPTSAQLRVLQAVEACSSPSDPADGWGEVFTHFDRANGTPSSLEMRNFDRSADACVRLGWLRANEGEGIALTETGSAVILAERARKQCAFRRGTGIALRPTERCRLLEGHAGDHAFARAGQEAP
jgi:hypothetical protein